MGATEDIYTMYFCLDGRKDKLEGKVEYSAKEKRLYEIDKECYPYDIIDEDDHNVWFDYGDE